MQLHQSTHSAVNHKRSSKIIKKETNPQTSDNTKTEKHVTFNDSDTIIQQKNNDDKKSSIKGPPSVNSSKSNEEKFDIMSLMKRMSQSVPEGDEIAALQAKISTEMNSIGSSSNFDIKSLQGMPHGAQMLGNFGQTNLDVPTELHSMDDLNIFRSRIQQQAAAMAPMMTTLGIDNTNPIQQMLEGKNKYAMSNKESRAGALATGMSKKYKMKCSVCHRGFNSERLWKLHEMSHANKQHQKRL